MEMIWHFLAPHDSEALCGQHFSAATDNWDRVTCAACLAKKLAQPPLTHMAGGLAGPLCGKPFCQFVSGEGWVGSSRPWSDVTCPECLAKKPEATITEGSEPTSREDLVRQRNWAMDEAKKLKDDLKACQEELEAMRKQFPTTREQATPPPRPPLPDLNELYQTVGANLCREQWGAAIHRLRFAISQIVKHLKP